MPDLKRAAETGSNMNGCLIWALIGGLLFIGISIGSGYLIFMTLLTGGAMLGGKAMKGKQAKDSTNSRINQYPQNPSIESRKDLIKSLPTTSSNSRVLNSSKSDNLPASPNNSLPPHRRVPASSTQKSTNANPANKAKERDLINQLERLAELKTNGHITDEEFNILKSKAFEKPIITKEDNATDYTIESVGQVSPQEADITKKKSFTPEDLI